MTPVATRTATRRGSRAPSPASPILVRAVVYCRISVAERVERDFDSLDAQRDACTAYVRSQSHQGWVLMPTIHEDNGFTGGNTDRPGLQRLLAEIEAGEVDVVIVSRIDRISRSLTDFVRMLEVFEQHNVAFVAVSQNVITSGPIGKLLLHILMSFAEFERSTIAARTSDFMCAARRRGQWLGGPPILGYDVDREKHRLVVNAEEAVSVRDIFDLYLRLQSALKVAVELNRRGWTTKSWVRKNGKAVVGARWTKAKVLRHLTNVTYIGKVAHKGEEYDGQHEGIVDEEVFRQVQDIIDANGQANNPLVRNKHAALLKGLIRCGKCGAAMAHTYTQKNKSTLYRYYVCNTRQSQGRDACDTPSLSVPDVEAFVVQQIRQIGQDPALVEQVYAEAQRQQRADVPKLEAEHTKLLQERQRKGAEINSMVALLSETPDPMPVVTAHLRETEEQVGSIDTRLRELKQHIEALKSQTIDAEHLRTTLLEFDPIWDVLHVQERIALVNQVVEKVVYDPTTESIHITLRCSS